MLPHECHPHQHVIARHIHTKVNSFHFSFKKHFYKQTQITIKVFLFYFFFCFEEICTKQNAKTK